MNLPQTPLDLIAGQLDWAHKNINNNLDFIPEDKLNWKPAAQAKSVLEIINHATTTVKFFTSVARGERPAEPTFATNRDEAKALVTQAIQNHLELLKTLGPDDLARTVSLPFADLPVGTVVGFPVTELINHHGQITYIQTLLGDSDSHLLFQ